MLWTVPVGQGYAGAAIVGGRVYHNDYDEKTSEWGVSVPVAGRRQAALALQGSPRIRPNHGITRTVPAVDARYVFSIDPKFPARPRREDRQAVWTQNLVAGLQNTTIPPWYDGQNPLMEEDRRCRAGRERPSWWLDKATGKEIWRMPNPGLALSHASVMPALLAGVKQYVYGTLNGPLRRVGGRRESALGLPVHVQCGRRPLAAPRRSGPCLPDRPTTRAASCSGCGRRPASRPSVFDLRCHEWNSEVHTPIVFKGHLFAVGKKKRGLFTCLAPDGKQVWTSEGRAAFDLGCFLLADGMFFVLDGKTGMLRLIEASTTGYKELASAQVLAAPTCGAARALGRQARPSATSARWCASTCAARQVARLSQFRHVRGIGGRGQRPRTASRSAAGVTGRATSLRGRRLGRAGVPADGTLRRRGPPVTRLAVAVDADGRAWVGERGQVEIYDQPVRSLTPGATTPGSAASRRSVSSTAMSSSATRPPRCVRRYDARGAA